MKILLINHYAGGPSFGMEHRPYYMAREWVACGHEVTIVASGFAHTRTHQPRVQTKIRQEMIDGIRYLWLKTPPYSGNTVSRILNMLIFIFRLRCNARSIARNFSPDLVIASSTYPLDIWPAHRIARYSGGKLVYEVHDLWPLSPMELGGYSRRHPYIMLLQRAENYAYKHSDKVVSLLPHTLEHMVSHGMEPEKFVYIPNGIVASDWEEKTDIPDEHQIIIDKLRGEGKMIIGYTGAHGIANALYPLVEATELTQDLPVGFLLVGNGPEKDNLHQKAKAAGLQNIFFTSSVAKHQLPSLLSQIDILYVGFQRQALYRFGVSPNKIFDYMMAGKPIIQAIEAGNNPVRDAGCGLSIEPDNPKAITEAIRQLIAMSSKDLKKMGEAGKEYVIANHDYSVLSLRFLESL